MPEPLNGHASFFTSDSMRFCADLRDLAAQGDNARIVELVSVTKPAILRRALATAIISERWSDADRAALAGIAA